MSPTAWKNTSNALLALSLVLLVVAIAGGGAPCYVAAAVAFAGSLLAAKLRRAKAKALKGPVSQT